MGNKTNPLSYRLNKVKNWSSFWYEKDHYTNNFHEDIIIEKFLKEFFYQRNFSFSNFYIERSNNKNIYLNFTLNPFSNYFSTKLPFYQLNQLNKRLLNKHRGIDFTLLSVNNKKSMHSIIDYKRDLLVALSSKGSINKVVSKKFCKKNLSIDKTFDYLISPKKTHFSFFSLNYSNFKTISPIIFTNNRRNSYYIINSKFIHNAKRKNYNIILANLPKLLFKSRDNSINNVIFSINGYNNNKRLDFFRYNITNNLNKFVFLNVIKNKFISTKYSYNVKFDSINILKEILKDLFVKVNLTSIKQLDLILSPKGFFILIMNIIFLIFLKLLPI